MKQSTRIIAIVLLFLNGISALFGGWGLISDPSGETLQMPLEFLKATPFENFLIPGIILFTVNGLFNIIVAVLSILKIKSYPYLIILAGAFLSGWISIQILMIKQFYAPLHVPYFLLGLLLIVCGFILIKNKKAV